MLVGASVSVRIRRRHPLIALGPKPREGEKGESREKATCG